MITLTKNGNAIVFTFSDNAHYLFDGTIEVPVNSLTLITDNSQMATFKKSASNDIFISATYAELGMSKSELESWFKENACGSTGGGGVTSGEVETMIETSLEDYYDIDEVDAALSAKANTATTYTKTEVDTALAAKANTATTYNKTEVDTALANKADTSAVTEAISSAVSGKVNTSTYNTFTAATDSRIAEDEEVTAAGLNALNDALGDKADTSAVTASIAAAVSGKQDTLIAGSGITISGNVISSEGGGATYSAGTNISIDSANTISCTLPISKGTGTNSIIIGDTSKNIATGLNSFAGGTGNVLGGCTASGQNSFAFGYKNTTQGINSVAFGEYLTTKNGDEASFGKFNISTRSETLFSVGNGTSSTNHNAFEIRNNGDIYCNNGTSDVKLQDYLQIKVVKLTQQEYDALVTKDPNTLYVIVD